MLYIPKTMDDIKARVKEAIGKGNLSSSSGGQPRMGHQIRASRTESLHRQWCTLPVHMVI